MLLGASLFTGLVGSFALKKNRQDTQEDYTLKYVGEWEFFDADKKTAHRLTIQPSLAISIDRQEIKVSLIELTKNRLVLQDEYGYHLIVQTNDDQNATLYDEADDNHHPLYAV